MFSLRMAGYMRRQRTITDDIEIGFPANLSTTNVGK